MVPCFKRGMSFCICTIFESVGAPNLIRFSWNEAFLGCCWTSNFETFKILQICFSSCVPLVWLWSVTRLGKAKKTFGDYSTVDTSSDTWNPLKHLPLTDFSQTGAGLFPSLAWSKQVVLFQFVVRSLLPTAQEYAHARQLVLQVWGAVDLTWQPVTVGSQKQSFNEL